MTQRKGAFARYGWIFGIVAVVAFFGLLITALTNYKVVTIQSSLHCGVYAMTVRETQTEGTPPVRQVSKVSMRCGDKVYGSRKGYHFGIPPGEWNGLQIGQGRYCVEKFATKIYGLVEEDFLDGCKGPDIPLPKPRPG